MKIKKYYLNNILLSAATMFFSTASQATTLQLSVFENSAGDFTGSIDIELIDENTVITTFTNTSLVNGPVIESLHFESGAADWISNPQWTNIDAPGNNETDIVFTLAAKPSGPPGGNNIGWTVNHNSGDTSYTFNAT